MGSVLTEIQSQQTPTRTGRTVKFTRVTMDVEVQVFNTETVIAHDGDYVIDAGDLGYDVMTAEVFGENYLVLEFDEDIQVGTAELLDSGYSI